MRLETMKPNPDDLQRVLVRLKEWADRKMKVDVHLCLGSVALVSVCDIEGVKDGAFCLIEVGRSRTYSVIPKRGSHVSLDDLEGISSVTIFSEDRGCDICISEASTNQDDLMARIVSKMIQ